MLDKDCELDSRLWKMVTVDGLPVAALYLNGREFSLPQCFADDLEKLIKGYMRDNGRDTSDK